MGVSLTSIEFLHDDSVYVDVGIRRCYTPMMYQVLLYASMKKSRLRERNSNGDYSRDKRASYIRPIMR